MEINLSPSQLKQEFPCSKSSNCSRLRGTVINQSSWNTHPARQLGACQEIQETKYEQALKWNHEGESFVKSCCSYYICGSSTEHPVGLLLVIREAFGKMSYMYSWDRYTCSWRREDWGQTGTCQTLICPSLSLISVSHQW